MEDFSEDEFTKNMKVIRFDEGGDKWDSISWAEFKAIRNAGETTPAPNELRGKTVYLMVCVLDEIGRLHNLIAHKYIFDEAGKNIDSRKSIAPDERAEWDRLYLLQEMTSEEEARLKEMQERAWLDQLPPKEAVRPFLWALPGSPATEESAAWHVIQKLTEYIGRFPLRTPHGGGTRQ